MTKAQLLAVGSTAGLCAGGYWCVVCGRHLHADEHTDWGKWLGFARAVYEAGRASSASVPGGFALVPVEIINRFQELNSSNYDHDDVCALNAWAVELVLAAAPTPPVSEDRKDAERYRALKTGDFAVDQFVSASYGWKATPTEELDSAIDAAMQEGKP